MEVTLCAFFMKNCNCPDGGGRVAADTAGEFGCCCFVPSAKSTVARASWLISDTLWEFASSIRSGTESPVQVLRQANPSSPLGPTNA